VTLELHATPEEVMRAVGALEEFCREKHVPEKVTFGLALALEECGSNIVNHAYRRDPQQKFKIGLEHTDNALNIELRDCGPEFDPTKAPPTPLDEHDDRPPGGWGMHLMRHYTDEISYRRENGVNILRLTRRLFG
jgi:anti-sigma regulatory factor (Ser/Thr protein kinase)